MSFSIITNKDLREAEEGSHTGQASAPLLTHIPKPFPDFRCDIKLSRPT